MSMLQCRDQWLRHIGQVNEPAAFAAALQRGLEGLQVSELALLQGELDQLPAAVRHSWGELLAWSNNNVQRKSPPVFSGLPPTQAEFLPYWSHAIDLLLTDAGDWRKRFDARQGFPAASDKNLEANEIALRKQRKEQISDLVSQLHGHASLHAQLLSVRSLPGGAFSLDELEQVSALAEVLRLAVAHLQLVFSQRRQVDHIEVALAATRALGGEEQPTDIAMMLDYRIQHILVDEFQDTSHQQFSLLEKLLEGWTGEDGRTLFLVGDPMQSIYRFREAEVGLFLRTRRAGIGGLPITPLTLTVNFRARGHLVQRANALFAQIFPAEEQITRGAVCFSPAEPYQEAFDDQPLQYHFGAGNRLQEAEKVVELIRRELNHQQDKPRTIAVLVKSRGHLAEILPALQRAGIPFQGVELQTLNHSPAVLDLLILTRCLLQPADHTAWLALLRAPWSGLSLADLSLMVEQAMGESINETENRKGNKPSNKPGQGGGQTLYQLILSGAMSLSLSPEAQEKLALLRQTLQPVISARGVALHLRVETLWMGLAGPATLTSSSELEDCRAFLELLANLESAGRVDLALLQRKLEKLYALPDAEAGEQVQLMTIHRSKGLQFDTLIIPGLDGTTKGDDKPLLAWLDWVSDQAHSDLLLAPIRAPGKEEHPLFSYITRIKSQQAAQEQIRLLYVAITRAKKRVHLLGQVTVVDDALKPPRSGSLLKLLWPDAEAEAIKQLLTEPSTDQTNSASSQEDNSGLLRRLPPGWKRPQASPSFAWRGNVQEEQPAYETLVFDWAGEVARQVGTVAHAMLQKIGERQRETGVSIADESELPVGLIETLLIEAGIPADSKEQANNRVGQIIKTALSDPRGRWILNPDHQQSEFEFRLSGLIDGKRVNQIIDRTFIDRQGVRWIIDYKTGIHTGGGAESFLDNEKLRYQKQLDDYARLLRHLGPEPIMLGLYFPAFAGWREWPWAG